MKFMYMIAYRYKEGLNEDDLRTLTKRFVEVGNGPGIIAQYERLDGRGGFILEELDDPAAIYENILHYTPWVEFEVFPITTIQDAFPAILRVYG